MTFQAGLDSLSIVRPSSPAGDTLLVLAGDYPESVSVNNAAGWVFCLAGPESTSVRDFALVECSELLRINGLTILEHSRQRRDRRSNQIEWRDCAFRGGFTHVDGFICEPPRFRQCLFSGAVDFGCSGIYGSIDSCRFVNANVRLIGTLGTGWVRDCSFEDTPGLALHMISSDDYAVAVQRCTFRNVGTAIQFSGGGSEQGTVSRCRFESVGIAIWREGHTPTAYEYESDMPVLINDSRFISCGQAVHALGVDQLRMNADTLVRCSEIGILASASIVALSGVIVSDGRADGAEITQVEFASGYSRLPEVTIQNCRFANNQGFGLVLRDSVGADVFPAPDSVMSCDFDGNGASGLTLDVVRGVLQASRFRGNGRHGVEVVGAGKTVRIDQSTFAANAGDGVRVAETCGSLAIYRGLFTANAGAGISVSGLPQITAEFCDFWNNAQGPFSGWTSRDANLSADPLVCTPSPEPYTYIALGSPCGIGGPFGRIGAVREGCPAIGVVSRPERGR